MRAEGILGARLALGWMVGGEWRAHPARLALTAIAIAVGVALGFAVHLINGSALASFEDALHGVSGAADLQVSATGPTGFDERLYPRVARLAGVADASPAVVLPARVGPAAVTLIGLDPIRAAQVTPALVGLVPGVEAEAGAALFDPDALFLSRAALAATGARVGDPVTVRAGGRANRFRVAGTLPGAGADQAVATVDIAAAQERFGRLGRLDRIDVRRGAAGLDARLGAALPADAVLGTPAAQATRSDALSRAYRVNLDMLALVALLTGGFLVFSAQSLAVARRLRAFALLRTLGLPPGGVVALVTVEGIVVGLLGAALGLAAGYGLARTALARFGGDLGAGYFGAGGVRLAFQPQAAAAFFLLGLAAAVGGSVLPARLAARAAPAVALRNPGDALDPRARLPWRPAAILVALGGLAALMPAANGLPLFGFASMALILAGGIAAMPWLARALLAVPARRAWRPVPLDLALRHLHGAPGQAATALCGIVASTALMIAMATMVTSFRGAVDAWLGDVLAADLYLAGTGAGAAFDPATQAALRATPGVRAIAFSRQAPLAFAADRPPLTLIARPVGTAGAPPLMLIRRAVSLPSGAVPAWASEPAARLYRWRVGDRVRLPIGPGGTAVAIAGIWRDYARQQGAVVLRDTDYTRLTGDAARDEAAVTLAPGTPAEAVARRIAGRLPPSLRGLVQVTRPAALRAYALRLFDRSFAVTYLLEGVAILVGLAGVAATVSAQTIARTREFGMLRHVGVSRRQVVAMLAGEGALLGLVGGVAGVALGLLLAEVLIHVINPQSFNWTMATIVPWRRLGGVVAALVAAASTTAMLAGRRAVAVGAVRAVREDW